MNANHLKKQTIEATPDGIKFMIKDDSGIYQHCKLIGYKAAIRSLDRGDYDKEAPAGLRLAAAILEGEAAGFYTPDNEHRTVFWRWLVADIFIRTMAEENGVTEIDNESGGVDRPALYVGKHGGISVYPFAERFSLANHIEAIAIEKLGVNDGYIMAVRMYQDMITKDFSLSDWGRSAFATLHDSFIKRINESGIPDQPLHH